MSRQPISARVTLVAVLLSSLAAVTCGGRSNLDAPGSSAGGQAAGTGGAAGAVAGRGGALGTSGAVGTSGAGSGGCPSDLDSNPKHCGRCNRDCEGGECSFGICKPVVIAELGDEAATALALDAANVYWARPIMRLPKTGGTPLLLSRDTPDAVWGIAVDNAHVFWGSPTYGPVRRVTKTSAAAPQALTSDNLGANRIAVDATGIYFTSHGVYRVSHDGSVLRMLTPEGDTGIALDQDFVYFTSRTKGEVYRMTKDGGDLTRLATAPLANEVAVFGDFVVFTAHGDGLVRRVPRSGGPAIVIGASSGDGVAIDADGVYVTELDTGTVGYVPIEGYPDGSLLALALNQQRPRAIATDEKRVFWTTDGPPSTVVKVVKAFPGASTQ